MDEPGIETGGAASGGGVKEGDAPAPSISIDVDYATRVNFAIQQDGVPLAERISLTNTGAEALRDLVLSVALENGECETWTGRVERIDPGATYGVEPDSLRLDARKLAMRTEAERTALRVEVSAAPPGGTVQRSFPIDLLAFDQWPGVGVYPELLAAFVTPNHPKVAELLAGARRSLSESGVPDGLEGYQSGSRQRAAQIAEACFNAVKARGIGYINPPASFDSEGQRVRLVDRICREGFGSCLDLSLLLAGMWEQAGLHPLVLLLEGHALPAVWTHESHLPEAAIDEAARIRNLVELGEVVPVESTLVTQQQGGTFGAAVEAAKRRLGSPGSGFCAVDVRSGRKRGVRPLPLRAEGESTAVDLDAMAEGAPAPAGTVVDRVALADRAESARGGGAAAEETGSDRIRRWQTRLLDLSLRNRLINFRETGRTLRLMAPDITRLEDKLADEDRFVIHPKTEGDEAFLREQLEADHVYSAEAAAEMQKRMLLLYRTARAGIEETGANLLHVALGMLKWYESDASAAPRYAPLVLLPVELFRHSTGAGYRYEMALSDEPVRPNVTLLEKLRTEFGMETAGLESLPEDENGLDLALILRNFRAAIRETSRWEVEESAYLGLFSFNKFLMWRDLQENMAGLRKNRLVVHLIDRAPGEFDPAPFPRPDDLDDQVKPGELHCTRDADSTQLAAVRAAADGRTFVLEGPPGTGKSQTIANIISDSLARGKRVLFVAEKMAALSVVSRRLEEDGLGPFCLELHSAKSSKKEVLAQLDAALAVGAAAAPADWATLCEEVGETRERLNRYVRELHEPRASGESLYRVMGRLARLGEGARVGVGENAEATTAAQLAVWRKQLGAMVEAAAAVDAVHEHALRGVGRTEWSFTLPAEAAGVLKGASRTMEEVGRCVAAFLGAVGGAQEIVDELGHEGVQALSALAKLLLLSPLPDAGLVNAADVPAVLKDLRVLSEAGKVRDAKRNDLLSRYRVEFLEIDHLVHISAVARATRMPGPLRWFAGILARRKLRAYATGRVPDLRTLGADLEAAREVKQLSAKLAGASEAARLLGRRWNGGGADWAEIDRVLEWCAKFHEAGAVLRRGPLGAALAQALGLLAGDASRVEMVKPSATAMVNAWNRWSGAWDGVKRVLVTSEEEAFGPPGEARWLARAGEVLARWQAGIPELNDWCAWRRARGASVDNGLGGIVEAYEAGELALAEVTDAFERSFGEKWFNGVANGVGAIRDFNAGAHARVIERFRLVDSWLIGKTRDAVTAKLGERAPAGTAQASAQSEMGILRRELQKKRRHLPTRRLIEAMPNLLARLKPCFLMSPLSVAQYLDAKLPAFDLVVFDEASQIPVWDSIGAIARGTEVIVVGDSKQLPPTTFFDTLDGEEEPEVVDEAVEDMESILKECNAAGVPPMHLNWHYRSRHESLIAFSNRHYYENRLHTFPSPEERSADLGVTFRHVKEAVYDRGGTRTNRIEAEQVVEEVCRRLMMPGESGSIGVVTFNQAQQGLIEDLLDAKRREDPELEKFFGDEVNEPVFVKNLENVQGDERDTIIFSVGYGLDQAGRASMNFGPLNKEGGERRLNVAVTRSRRRLIVFSSLRSDQIDLQRTRSAGVKDFKTFLDYADRGPRAMAEAVGQTGSREFDSGLERAVRDALKERGWAVDTQIGCAGYRVDLAVREPGRAGPVRYLIGIECDGAAYHSARTARDRDRLRHSVLKGLGWRMERVWSPEWRLNPARCIAAIEQAIREAQQGAAPPPLPVAAAVEPAKAARPSEGGNATGVNASGPTAAPTRRAGPPVYVRAKPTRKGLPKLDIFDGGSMFVAIEALGEIVRVEGPIVEELALRRLAEWFGTPRVTERYRARFAEVLAGALRSRPIRMVDAVLWASEPQAAGAGEFTMFRVPGEDEEDCRDIEDIPLVERMNGVVHVLEAQFGMPREELERETAKVFGITRATARAREAIGEAIDAAIALGRAEERDGRVSPARQ